MRKRPSPEETGDILGSLADSPGGSVSISTLVAAIRRETGCSRATAYRAVADALAAGAISRDGEISEE